MEAVEDNVNARILQNVKVETEIRDLQEALKSGVTALFGEKYGESVRVVRVPGVSAELCGGTHSGSTGEIGIFVIISEGSVASGIRRIEALTGKAAYDYLRQKKNQLEEIKGLLKTDRPLEKIEKILGDARLMEKEIRKLKTSPSRDVISDALKEALEFSGVKVVKIRQDGLDPNELRILADNVRDRLKSGIIVASSLTNSHAAVVCMVTKDLTDQYNAGDIMKHISKIAGGKGGGRPDIAQGGIQDIEKLGPALESLRDVFKKQTKG